MRRTGQINTLHVFALQVACCKPHAVADRYCKAHMATSGKRAASGVQAASGKRLVVACGLRRLRFAAACLRAGCLCLLEQRLGLLQEVFVFFAPCLGHLCLVAVPCLPMAGSNAANACTHARLPQATECRYQAANYSQ